MKREISISGQLDVMAADCIAVRVRLINRVLTGIYDEALRPHGLRVSQGNILVAVARMGEARPADVCRRLKLEKSTLSRDVEVMKRHGWLESDPPAGGPRQVLRITSRGMDLLAKCQPAWESAQAEARQLIGESGVDAIHQIAEKLGLRPPSN
jgi:DNA-binding MarR family transcriptional regulator